jgi:hypothetical protein
MYSFSKERMKEYKRRKKLNKKRDTEQMAQACHMSVWKYKLRRMYYDLKYKILK